MGGRSSRTLYAIASTSALVLASLGSAGAALAADTCDKDAPPPGPPYVGPAITIEFERDEDVRLEYFATTAPDPTDRHRYSQGDIAAGAGGCEDALHPLLITFWEDPLVPMGLGVGTPADCTVRAWATLHGRDMHPDAPNTYTVVAHSSGPCEGAYVDVIEEGGFVVERRQPESTKASAIIRYYPPGSATPTEPVTISGEVGVFNEISQSLYGEKYGGDYVSPPYVALGTVTLPPIGSGAGETATVVPASTPELSIESADPTDGPSPDADTDAAESAEPIRLVHTKAGRLLVSLLLMIRMDEELPEATRHRANAMLGLLLLLRSDLEGALDEGPAEVAPPPKGRPPKGKLKPGHKWVSLPSEATVDKASSSSGRSKLKTGVWYQMKERDDGTRRFFNKKGELLGTSPPADADEVRVREWRKGTEVSDASGQDPDDAVGTAATDVDGGHSQAPAEEALSSFVKDGDGYLPTPSAAQQKQLKPGFMWAYLTESVLANDWGRDELNRTSGWDEELWPGKWYQVERNYDGSSWDVYSEGGNYRGTVEHDTSMVRLWSPEAEEAFVEVLEWFDPDPPPADPPPQQVADEVRTQIETGDGDWVALKRSTAVIAFDAYVEWKNDSDKASFVPPADRVRLEPGTWYAATESDTHITLSDADGNAVAIIPVNDRPSFHVWELPARQ